MMRKNIAEACKSAPDPYQSAAVHAVFKSTPSPMRTIFHFADGSYLAFEVSYTPAEVGEWSR